MRLHLLLLLLLRTAALTVALTGTLRQADGVRAALDGAASHATDTANDVGATLQGLTEEAYNVRHFYSRGRLF